MLKSYKASRKKGATLGLVAVVALVVIAVGIAFFFLIRMLGASSELNCSVEAATLNAAKAALRKPTVNVAKLGLTEFAGLGENGSDEISLYTYNKAVAAVLLVAMNAEEEKTASARAHAKKIADDLVKLGTALADKMKDEPDIESAFDGFSRFNSLKFLGRDSKFVRTAPLEFAYLKPGRSTNIYFDPKEIPPSVNLSPYLNTDKDAARSETGQPYVRGYVPLSVGGITCWGVPVFPCDRPHQISLTDFDAAREFPNRAVQDAIPPNALKAIAKAQDARTSYFIQSAAAAVVGCARPVLTQQTGTPAEFPDGYIRIHNKPGMSPNANWSAITSDGSNDIFNKEMYSPSKILQSTNKVFTTDEKQMMAWIAFNTGSGPDPRTMGFDLSKMRKGKERGRTATIEDLLSIRQLECTCTHTEYDGFLQGECLLLDNVSVWTGNYQREQKIKPLPQNNDYTVVEYCKAAVLEARSRTLYGGMVAQAIWVDAPDMATGMKLFDHNGAYPTPQHPVNFGTIGTPWQLMKQVGDCASNPRSEIFEEIVRRCAQIKPGVTADEVVAVLNSKPIPLNTTFYIYRKEGGNLVMDAVGPKGMTAIQPDGEKSATPCQSKYPLNNRAVNSKGEANFDDACYSKCLGLDPVDNIALTWWGIDRANWTPASGFENLLGVLEFENLVPADAVFMMPN